jgi:hypothetical protein
MKYFRWISGLLLTAQVRFFAHWADSLCPDTSRKPGSKEKNKSSSSTPNSLIKERIQFIECDA